MSMSYEEYEKECARIREENKAYLAAFEAELKKAGLSPKTIRNHLFNVDLYLNDYQLREGPYSMEEGMCGLDGFFWFFIHKCMWSTPSNVKSTAASIKKFYKCMAELGKVDAREYALFAAEVREGVPDWQQECVEFNDPDWEPEW